MAVEVGGGAFQIDEGDQVQFAQVEAALAVVVRLLAQGRGQALLQFGRADTPGFGLAAHQLAEGEGAAAAFQFGAPFVIQAATFVQNEKHFEVGIAK